MNQIHAMRVFVRVAETQSFRRAAQQLDVSNALVTRSVAMLEAHLNTRLINRTTRNLALTEAGLRYLEGCRCVLEELDHLESSVTHTESEPSGTLRVVATGALSPASLTPLIDGYRRLYPRVSVRLTLAERHVDFVEDGFDVGIVGAVPARNGEFVAHALGTTTFVPCASPGWLAEHGEPHTPAQLAHYAAVALPPEARSATWQFARPGERAQHVTLQPGYAVNNMLMVRLAALAGMGVAIVPASLVADDFAAGTLRRLLPDYEIDDPDARMSIVYPSRRYLPAKTRCFVDYTVVHFENAGDARAAANPTSPSASASIRPLNVVTGSAALRAMSGS
ncbi:LysR family transcriptional regulator [Paraburkholderia lycopersici]|uniref:DNA-binding transcriptional regulator, LysR family n=1 Tax=Paraburkholderia lycopersici TaxID=416944 RepID=A0A1G6GKV0_9BURK|nr:LysR family transcriptional regulator [Paraburkholderia lycopersici]SDB82580.1 DNA-binding transcriptional regulator, LysR family [Paraburkholderia lycopersici]